MSTQPGALGPPAHLEQVIERIAAMETLPTQKRHDMASAVRGVARVLDAFPADIPADPQFLKRRLGILTPSAAGMTKARWRNVRALLTSALALTGAKVMRGRRRDALRLDWLALLEGVGDLYQRARLSRFFSYVSENGIRPNDVGDSTVADFAESMKRNSLLERQMVIVRSLCVTWNDCSEKIEDWPATRLTVPSRRRDFALPASAYPQPFGADVAGYLDHLARGDLFGGTGRGPASPVTVNGVRLQLFQMAAALVQSGRDPQTLRSLADLVEPTALKAVLTFFWTRNGARKTGQLHNFAMTAIKIAKYWVKSPSEQIAALQAIRRQVEPPNKTARGYWHWLRWLDAHGFCDPDTSAADRVTRDRVAAYVAELTPVCAPFTVLCRIRELLDAMRVMAPQTDWAWLLKLHRGLSGGRSTCARQVPALEAGRRAR